MYIAPSVWANIRAIRKETIPPKSAPVWLLLDGQKYRVAFPCIARCPEAIGKWLEVVVVTKDDNSSDIPLVRVEAENAELETQIDTFIKEGLKEVMTLIKDVDGVECLYGAKSQKVAGK